MLELGKFVETNATIFLTNAFCTQWPLLVNNIANCSIQVDFLSLKKSL